MKKFRIRIIGIGGLLILAALHPAVEESSAGAVNAHTPPEERSVNRVPIFDDFDIEATEGPGVMIAIKKSAMPTLYGNSDVVNAVGSCVSDLASGRFTQRWREFYKSRSERADIRTVADEARDKQSTASDIRFPPALCIARISARLFYQGSVSGMHNEIEGPDEGSAQFWRILLSKFTPKGIDNAAKYSSNELLKELSACENDADSLGCNGLPGVDQPSADTNNRYGAVSGLLQGVIVGRIKENVLWASRIIDMDGRHLSAATAVTETARAAFSSSQYNSTQPSTAASASASHADIESKSLNGLVPLISASGHAYVYVQERNVTWYDAEAAAERMTFQGRRGYLATIDSRADYRFVMARVFASFVPGVTYLGGKQTEPGEWRWVTGRDGASDGGRGKLFWLGYENGTTQRGEFATWMRSAFQHGGAWDIERVKFVTLFSYSRPKFSTSLGTGTPEEGVSGYLVEFDLNDSGR